MTTQLELQQVSQSPPPSPTTAVPTSAKRVMVVEDESVISLDIKTSLTRLGYSIAGVAASGDIALRKIRETRPDVILMDIHLKGEMTGIDVSEQVRSELQIPIVFLTANADSSTFKEANQTDPYGYLLKPFEEKELGIAIEIALHKHEKEQIIRSSEHWYATAFQSLSEAVIATDRHGDVVFMNALAESMTQWPLAEALDRPVSDVLAFQKKDESAESGGKVEPTGSVVNAALSAVLEGVGVMSLPSQAQLLTRSFHMVPVEGHVVAMRDATGYVTGALFTLRAIAISADAGVETDEAVAEVEAAKRELSARSPILLSQLPQQNSTIVSRAASTNQSISPANVEYLKSFIESFINEQPTYFSSTDLIASYGKDLATLTSRKEGIVVTGKLVRNSLTAIVTRDSIYWETVCHILMENSFFPVSQRTNGTCYFQQCNIPKDCQVYRTPATELWDVWYGKACPGKIDPENTQGLTHGQKVSRKDLLILRRGSWYHIQGMLSAEGNVRIKTIAGELFVSNEDLIVWGTQRWL
ncbi:MAG: response regulator [Phormidesmis sp.]